MKLSETDYATMLERLRPFLGTDASSRDFEYPSTLLDVPSISSDRVVVEIAAHGENGYAQLG